MGSAANLQLEIDPARVYQEKLEELRFKIDNDLEAEKTPLQAPLQAASRHC